MSSVSERVYSELPCQPAELVSAFNLDKIVPRNFSEEFLEGNVNSRKVEEKSHILTYQSFILDPCRPRRKLPKFNARLKKLSSKEKRKLHVHSLANSNIRYSDMMQLHHLWVKYMKEIIQFDSPSFNGKNKNLEDLLLRADYHGCLVRVNQSKCPVYVGMTGIIIQDTKETLKLINKDNQIKTIPKRNSIFTFRLGDHQFKIYGNNFNFRPMDRVNKKFKSHYTIDL